MHKNILPWGTNEYQTLPIEQYNIPDSFQEKMNELFNGFQKFGAYNCGLLIIYNSHFDDHSIKLKQLQHYLKPSTWKNSFFPKLVKNILVSKTLEKT